MSGTDKIEVSSSTVDTAVEKVSGMLEQLAQQLGIAVEHFYPIFLKQQFITGVYDAVIAAVTFTISALLFWGAYTSIKDKDDAAFGFGLFTLIFLVISLVLGWQAVTHLYNPEYHALKDIGDFAGDFK